MSTTVLTTNKHTLLLLGRAFIRYSFWPALLAALSLLLLCSVDIWLFNYHETVWESLQGNLWLTTSVLKVLTVALLLLLFWRSYAHIANNPRLALRASLVWAISGVTIAVVLALTRMQWVPLISCCAVKFYPDISAYDFSKADIQANFVLWQMAWNNGLVLLSEVALLVALAAMYGWIGYRLGVWPWLALATGLGGSALLYSVALALTPWALWDYDFFHGDIFLSAMLVDGVFFFMSLMPYTAISALFYMGGVIACGVILAQPAAPWPEPREQADDKQAESEAA